jgi:hypothetical protein
MYNIFKMLGAMEPKIYAIINLVHVIKHVHATVFRTASSSTEPINISHGTDNILKIEP